MLIYVNSRPNRTLSNRHPHVNVFDKSAIISTFHSFEPTPKLTSFSPFTKNQINTMPPHLHPRSKFTSSLFAGTLFASFFVVALPHVLPCPAPRVAYADDGSGSQRPRRRRRKCPTDEVGEQEQGQGQTQAQRQLKAEGEDGGARVQYKDFNERIQEEMGGSGEADDGEEIEGRRKSAKRECPVPKPGGIVGGLLGFKPNVDEKGSRPP